MIPIKVNTSSHKLFYFIMGSVSWFWLGEHYEHVLDKNSLMVPIFL